MIKEITLENFRGFTSLTLKDLERINVVVGPNNSGKTSLLEAVLLLCEPKRIGDLPGLLRTIQGNVDVRYFRWLLHDSAMGSKGELKCEVDSGQNRVILGGRGFRNHDVSTSSATSQIYGTKNMHAWMSRDWQDLPCRVISVQQQTSAALVSLVGKAQRKSAGEETLQNLLASVDPRIRKVRIDPGEDGNQVIVDIGLSELLPVSQVGQGLYRLMEIMAEIIGDTPKVVVIDEIENGLHHSVHEVVWKGLAETADKLDVQLFVTTHSAECLEAAHRAFRTRNNYSLAVIQLFRIESGIQGRVLDRKHIEAAMAGEIDLR
jgi:predicted ATPase